MNKKELVEQVVAPTGCAVQVRYDHGVPPVVNAAACVERQRAGAAAAAARTPTANAGAPAHA